MKDIFNFLTAIFFTLYYTFKSGFENFTGRSVEHLADDAHFRASQLQHFDESFDDFDDFDNLEDLDDFEAENLESTFENYVETYRRKGMAGKTAMIAADKRMSKNFGGKWRKAKAKKASGLSRKPLIGKTGQPINASFTLKITRTGTNCDGALPVPIFGHMHAINNYSELIGAMLPANTILDSVTIQGQANVTLKYKNTVANTYDYVNIECQEIGYTTFLAASATDIFSVNKLRYTIDDLTELTQFGNKLAVVSKSLFGALQENQINASSQKDPKQYQNGIIDLNYAMAFDKETAILTKINKKDGFSFTFNIFVDHYVKNDVSRLR